MSTNIYKFQQTLDYDKWRQELRDYIRDNLIPAYLPITKDEDQSIKDQRSLLISDQAMKEVWEPVFTHSSYDPRVDRNFEVYEFHGDKILGYALSKYMKMRYPKSTQENLTNYNSAFTSRNPLGVVAREKGMLPHIRTLAKIEEVKGKTKSVKQQSDIVEAVIGGIMSATNRYINPALGEVHAIAYVFSIYNWFMDEHAKERGESGVINRVMQDYYDTLGWKKASDKKEIFEIIDKDEDGYTTVSIKLNQKAIDMLRKYFRDLKLENIENKIGEIKKENNEEIAILASGEGIDKSEATENAYRAAYEKLVKVFGITPTKARELGDEIFFNNNTTKKKAEQIITKLNERNQKEGIKWLKSSFFDDSLKKKAKIYNLVGYNDDGVVGVVYRIMFSQDPKDRRLDEPLTDDDIRMKLYQGYANKGPLKEYTYVFEKIESPSKT